MSDISDASAKYFARSIIPLYHNACVIIGVNPSDYSYTVSKDLLCRESKYFSAMFEGRFKEGQQQTTTLEEVEGVVSVQSLEAFLQWLYLGRIKFDLDKPEHHIAAAIELARFADMCDTAGMESQICRYIKDILIANPCPEYVGGVAVHTYCLTSQHIISATFLPQGHAIRRILAAATADGYLLCENHKFAKEAREYPTYGVDLLQEVGLVLKGLKFEQYKATHEDPLTGNKRNIYRFRSS
ncbi:uncharacterized protein N7484_005300 [Penicillium longicatenatum]|uniref:uncharacterized protein n=1 Tax=Penicillium longicatenatum TaxID=1561947 RepID=UPI00254860ED|nr:uncharacterized protein N7484_005300 [Penicillium longicatenatum]KAJ5651577.1 hypothetical protein N7484_005300 [Penicillium longicatenatum]